MSVVAPSAGTLAQMEQKVVARKYSFASDDTTGVNYELHADNVLTGDWGGVKSTREDEIPVLSNMILGRLMC